MATATSARLCTPTGVTVDGTGNLLIADYCNNRIQVVADTSGAFYGQAMTAGDIYSVAGDGVKGFSGDGGPATSCEMHYPAGVAVDSAGNLLVADLGNGRVRVVAAATGTFYGQAMTAGDIYTIAANGKLGFSGDGAPATKAEIAPYGVAVDGNANLMISDAYNNRVRLVTSGGTS